MDKLFSLMTHCLYDFSEPRVGVNWWSICSGFDSNNLNACPAKQFCLFVCLFCCLNIIDHEVMLGYFR